VKALVSVLFVLAVGTPLCGATLTVDDDGPADYNNIQAAVTAAMPGDTVSLADGVYTGPANQAIDFGGKAITLKSAHGPARCILDCQSRDRGIYFRHSETPMAVVDGLTIMNGRASEGGAIFCSDMTSATIRNCILRDNNATYRGGAIATGYNSAPVIEGCLIYANTAESSGGGISCWQTTLTLTDCTISRNTTRGEGGGLHFYSSTVNVSRCTFSGNTAVSDGGAIYFSQAAPAFSNCVFTDNQASYGGGAVSCSYGTAGIVVNCTFRGNTTANRGGGVLCSNGGAITLTNCIFASHTQHAVYREWAASVTIADCLFNENQPGDVHDDETNASYSGAQIDGLWAGNVNNLSGDPRFALAGNVRLLGDSPCIDRGTNEPGRPLPETDLDGNPRILDGNGDGTTVADIGAFEYNSVRPSIAVSPAEIEFVREPDGTGPDPVDVQIQNCGGGTLSWQIDANCPWLTFEPASGSISGPANEATISADVDGLSQGIHQAVLTVSGDNAANSPRTILVTLRVKGTLHVPGQFATIQEAIAAAMPGETVEVAPGTYKEGVQIQKKVRLVGIDRPTIDANGVADAVIWLSSDGCTIDGFRIIGTSIGIQVDSSNNTIANNFITSRLQGIQVSSQRTGNILTSNEIAECADAGLRLSYSRNATLRNNSLHGNGVNFDVIGSSTADYEHDIDTSNTADGKPIYYLVGRNSIAIGKDTNAACVVAVNCWGLTISDLTLSHNAYGVLLVGTTGSRIERVTATNNATAGIWLQESPGNTLTGNTVTDGRCGIEIYDSPNNVLESNVMARNRYNFSCEGSHDQLNQTIDTSNTVDGRLIYYLIARNQVVLNPSSRAGCVFAIDCSNVLVQSLTLQNNGAGVTFVNTRDSVVEDVNAINNNLAGIVLQTCTGCTVRRSTVAGNGDGISVQNSKTIQIDRDRISYNHRGIWAYYSDADVTNCFINANCQGGGIVLETQAQFDITNCTVYGNAGQNQSYPDVSGIVCGYLDTVTITNTIIWGNRGGQITASTRDMPPGLLSITVRYCDVQAGYEGEGNISSPPMLTPDGHLCFGSPCIDKTMRRGEFPPYDIDGERRAQRQRADIGCDEYIDSDSDRLPDWWEQSYFGDSTAAGPDGNADNDGHTNVAEYERFSSDPTVPAFVYYVDADRPDDSNDGLSWDTAKKTVQAAIDLAEDSDTIYIAPGLYPGNVTTRGRQILIAGLDAEDPAVTAATILAGIFTIGSGEMSGCTIEGLTISNKSGPGLVCSNSSPTIRHCLIAGNRSWDWQSGAGVTLRNASPEITHCTISGNTSQRGPGLYCQSASPIVQHCVIAGNVSNNGYGGDATAVYAEQSDIAIANCTIAHNVNAFQGSSYGSAIQCYTSKVALTNSILWNRLPLQVDSQESSIDVTYSDVYGGNAAIKGLTRAAGNITVDPCFVEAGSWDRSPTYSDSRWTDGDYHLRSTGWRWTANITHGTHWVWDGETSRCIDAGCPANPLGEEPVAIPNDPDLEWGENIRIDMGAYGGTEEASMAPPGWALLTDTNNDGLVNLLDFARAAQDLRSHAVSRPGDADRNGTVDYHDLALLADQWLQTTTWRK
jgi:parallel beta-helix repeat protein/predicted outer membrane repeat protein